MNPVLSLGLLAFAVLASANGARALMVADPYQDASGSPEVIQRGAVYTSDEVTRGRRLDRYQRHGPVTSREIEDAMGADCDRRDRVAARDFIRECWQRKQRGYLVINTESFAQYQSHPLARIWPTTLHIFVEPNSSGKWQVVWINVDHLGQAGPPFQYDSVTNREMPGGICNSERQPPYTLLRFSGKGAEDRFL